MSLSVIPESVMKKCRSNAMRTVPEFRFGDEFGALETDDLLDLLDSFAGHSNDVMWGRKFLTDEDSMVRECVNQRGKTVEGFYELDDGFVQMTQDMGHLLPMRLSHLLPDYPLHFSNNFTPLAGVADSTDEVRDYVNFLRWGFSSTADGRKLPANTEWRRMVRKKLSDIDFIVRVSECGDFGGFADAPHIGRWLGHQYDKLTEKQGGQEQERASSWVSLEDAYRGGVLSPDVFVKFELLAI